VCVGVCVCVCVVVRMCMCACVPLPHAAAPSQKGGRRGVVTCDMPV